LESGALTADHGLEKPSAMRRDAVRVGRSRSDLYAGGIKKVIRDLDKLIRLRGPVHDHAIQPLLIVAVAL
jgi:hypothetical protein